MCRPLSERYVELEQSFDRWRQQFVDVTSSFSQHAIGHRDAVESDLPAIIRDTSTSPRTVPSTNSDASTR